MIVNECGDGGEGVALLACPVSFFNQQINHVSLLLLGVGKNPFLLLALVQEEQFNYEIKSYINVLITF